MKDLLGLVAFVIVVLSLLTLFNVGDSRQSAKEAWHFVRSQPLEQIDQWAGVKTSTTSSTAK